ncbi:MAG TPA: DUF2911 domain-containing protein [Gemmatimonadales bacterium]|nr:DUF2911 domain-containing protein [Gemmatimonadales bacterium]
MRLFRIAALPCFLLAVPALLTAQAPAARGGFVVTLGDDTLSAEQFVRTDSSLEVTRVARSPRVTVLTVRADLGPDARIVRFTSESRPGGMLEQPASQTSSVVFTDTSAQVTLRQGDSTRSYATAVSPHALPMLSGTYSLYDQATRHAVAAGQDSIPLQFVFPGAMNPLPSYVVRRGVDSAVIGTFGLPSYARIGPDGQLLGLDGRETTAKVKVSRVDSMDIAGLVKAWTLAESERGVAGNLSPRDTAEAVIGNSRVTVDYGRPRKRGRMIFGGIVPWGEVWRTGANAATQLMVESPVTLGDTIKLQPGVYTLWTLPTEDGATLIINGQAGQWGTEYHAERDIGRVPLVVSAGPEVEMFTIQVEERGDSRGAIVFAWDTTRWEAAFEVE